jgi:putative redox protein
VVKAKVDWKKGAQLEGAAESRPAITVDGDGHSGNTPMELVLVALCGCTAYDVVTILQKKREPMTALRVSVQAEKAPQPPRVYTHIKLTYRVTGKVSRKSVEDAVRLSEEKYCSVSAMLAKTAKITYEIELDSDE